MLFGKKPIKDFLTYLDTKESVNVDAKELHTLLNTRLILDEKVKKLNKENEILRERVSGLQSILESHKYDDFDIMGKKSGAVLLLGNKGDTDSLWLQDPYVIFVNGIYKMWYSGNNDYRWRIHYATSKDGKKWIKHGLALNTDTNNIIEVYNECRPSVIYDGSMFHMWYEGDGNGNYYSVIYYTTSTDGVNWKKQGMVLKPGDYGETDEISVYNPNVVFDGSIFHMWYAGIGNKCSKIHYATSEDGLNWTKHGVVIPLCNDSNDECKREPFVIYDNKIFKMWYTSFIDGTFVIHYATSKDGKKWIDHGDVSQFIPKHIGEIYDIKTPCIIKDGDAYKAWFSCRVDDKWRIYYTELTESSITK